MGYNLKRKKIENSYEKKISIFEHTNNIMLEHFFKNLKKNHLV